MFAQRCSPTAWANAHNGSPRISGSCFWWGQCPSPHNLSYALPLGAVRCLTRCPLAQDFVLRVAAFSQTWLARVAARAAPARRCRVEQRFVFLVMCYLIIGLAVSGVSVLCFTWATVLRQCCREGASCGWRRSRKGVPTGSARTPRSTLRDARARGLTPFSQTYMRLISGVRAALFNLLGEHPQKLDVACSGRCAPPIFS